MRTHSRLYRILFCSQKFVLHIFCIFRSLHTRFAHVCSAPNANIFQSLQDLRTFAALQICTHTQDSELMTHTHTHSCYPNDFTMALQIQIVIFWGKNARGPLGDVEPASLEVVHGDHSLRKAPLGLWYVITFGKCWQTLDGSFSAVSKPILQTNTK